MQSATSQSCCQYIFFLTVNKIGSLANLKKKKKMQRLILRWRVLSCVLFHLLLSMAPFTLRVQSGPNPISSSSVTQIQLKNACYLIFFRSESDRIHKTCVCGTRGQQCLIWTDPGSAFVYSCLQLWRLCWIEAVWLRLDRGFILGVRLIM